jgi:hypothetical protein
MPIEEPHQEENARPAKAREMKPMKPPILTIVAAPTMIVITISTGAKCR